MTNTAGQAALSNVAITTNGSNSPAVDQETQLDVLGTTPPGGPIAITGGSITTFGANSFGVLTNAVGGTVTLDGTPITTSGAGAAGLFANAGTIIATNTTTQTSGAAAPSGLLSNGGTLTINGGSVTTTGAGSFGFLFEPFLAPPLTPSPPGANTLEINSATVNSAADAFHVQGAVADIAVNGSSVTSSNGVLLNTLSSGTTSLTAAASQLTGAITTDSTSTANVTLLGNTTWTMTGSSNLTNLTNSASTIDFGPPTGDPTLLSGYKTLTVNNYTGGGTIGLNTFLGTDGSASDRLIVKGGSATGSSFLRITNTGGPGAETVANGILVVQAINGGTTAPGAFVLAAGELRAGAFDYDLFRGSPGDATVANDWFLRSDFIVPPGILPPGTLPPPGPPVLPPAPPPEPLPPGVYPIIGPEIATYGVVQPLARQLGLASLGTLNDRVGDSYADGNARCVTASTPVVRNGPEVPAATGRCGLSAWPFSVWGLFFGQSIDSHYRAFADPRADGQLAGLQAGIDLLRGSFVAGQEERAGLYFAYGNTNVDVKGLVTNPAATAYILSRTGKLDLDAWSGGAYWTHVGPGGWYLDAVIQATRYDGSAKTVFAKLDTTGTGFISSLEGGYPFAFPQLGPGFVIEPQAQILWQRVAFEHANDGLGDVGLGKTSGASGRVGVRAKWTILTAGDQVWEPYLRVNLWEDWGARARTTFSGTDVVPLIERGKRLQFGGGLTAKINANLFLYANADYEFAVGNSNSGARRDGVRGAVGLRYTW
jgi:outer membrane autotransporter protein